VGDFNNDSLPDPFFTTVGCCAGIRPYGTAYEVKVATMNRFKKYIPQFILIAGSTGFLVLGFINNGVEAYTDNWPMTILGFSAALTLSWLAFGKALTSRK